MLLTKTVACSSVATNDNSYLLLTYIPTTAHTWSIVNIEENVVLWVLVSTWLLGVLVPAPQSALSVRR